MSFFWMSDLIRSLGDFAGNVGGNISSSIWDTMLAWLYLAIYNAISDFFSLIGNMGVEIFDLPWVEAVISLFSTFGWSLFIVGVVVSVFDLAVEYQSGRLSFKTTALNVLKAFLAVNLFSVLPLELYKFCISLQNTFASDLIRIFAGHQMQSMGIEAADVLRGVFNIANPSVSVFHLLSLIALGYCTVKVFFDNIKRGGILIIQIAVGSLYLFSVPRGFTDGFFQWCRQIVALCLTAFLQTTLLLLGLITFRAEMLLGIGIMLSASEVPRIAQQFGLDTSVKFNMSSAVNTASTAVNITRSVTNISKVAKAAA